MSEPSETYASHVSGAFAALGRGSRVDAVAELAAALPLLSAAVTTGATFLGTVSVQACAMSVAAGDASLAQAFAALTLADATRELERLGRWHRAQVERLERAGRGAPDVAALENARMVVADMYTYAVAFIPFVRRQTAVSLSNANANANAGPAATQASAIALILEQVRPRLDAAGWWNWTYDPAVVEAACFWSAYALVGLGGLRIENADTGRDVEDADRLVTGALALRPASAADRLQADALSLKARVLARYGLMQIDEAIGYAERSRAILETLPEAAALVAAERVNAGAFYAMKADLIAIDDAAGAATLRTTAEAYYRTAIDAYRIDDPYGKIADALTNLGVLLTTHEKWDEALAALEEADSRLPVARYTFERRAKIAVNIGSLLNDTRRWSDALPWFTRALAARPLDGSLTIDPEVDIMVHGGLAVATLRTAGAASAVPHFQAAIDVIETLRRSFFSERVNASLLQRFRWVYEAFIDCCATYGEADPIYRCRAFEVAERLKWRTLTTLLRYRPLHVIDEHAEPLLVQERTCLNFLSTRLLGNPDGVARDTEVVAAMQKLDAIWADLAQRHPQYVAIRREETIDAAGAFALLDEHVGVLIEYYFGDEYETALAFVFVRGETAPRIVRLPTSGAAVNMLTADLRRQTTAVPAAQFRTASAALFDAIVRPLLGGIAPGIGICIVPYGQLHNAPFAGLWDGTHYLIERNPLTIAASVSGLRWWIAKDRGPSDRCLVFAATGDIHADDVPLKNLGLFDDLARKQIAPLFASAVTIAGASATKEHLLQAFESAADDAADVVHIACHGIAKPNGLASILVMAGPDGDAHKDLTALEIAAAIRLNATLVTLSACDSAIAESTTGDNLAGLAPSFLLAGASSVIATLWEVRQDAGVAVMREFYQRWRGAGGEHSKIACLHAALCAVAREKTGLAQGIDRIKGLLGFSDDFSHPYLWSTLQLYGNWR